MPYSTPQDIYHGSGASWEAVPGSEKPLVDTVEASWVMERLEQLAPAALLGEDHFFLGWGLHKPHLPFLFPEEHLAHYPLGRQCYNSTSLVW